MSQTKAQLVSGTTAQDLTVDNINTSSINSGQTSGRKNIIINGAMKVAQRGTSSTSSGYQTVDRFKTTIDNVDESPTITQSDVASGTTPYTLGFRKALKFQNGNQTSGAGTSDTIEVHTRLEGQDIANSGWNYKSSSSFITISFWIKSSVAQTFPAYLHTQSNPEYIFPFETGSLTADTWTKITKTIPGNTNLVFDNDNAHGLKVAFIAYRGTSNTDNSVTYDAWAAYNTATRAKDVTTTWYTTNDATWEITGLQLEVGSTATDFEHKSLGEELTLCQRYFQQYVNPCCTGVIPDNSSKAYSIGLQFQTRMRAVPTLTIANAGDGQNVHDGNSGADIASLNAADRNVNGASIYLNLDSDLGNFRPATLGRNDQTTNTTTYSFTAEL